MKAKNIYGVFVYDHNDNNIYWIHLQTKRGALSIARRYASHLELGQYVEVWLQEKEGLFGNSGMPIYKSDGYTELM